MAAWSTHRDGPAVCAPDLTNEITIEMDPSPATDETDQTSVYTTAQLRALLRLTETHETSAMKSSCQGEVEVPPPSPGPAAS